MNSVVLSIAAVCLYLFAVLSWSRGALRSEGAGTVSKQTLVIPGAMALLLHGLVVFPTLLTTTGMNFGFFNAASLVSWVVCLLVLSAVLVKPVENLALVFLPMAALALGLDQFFSNVRMVDSSTSAGLKMHIAVSILAYGMLMIAAAESVILAVQEHLLRSKRPVQAMRILPPLQVMEEILVQILTIGFFLLSLSLATGLMFVEDMFQQHLAHKTVFSIAAWLVFAAVLLGHWVRGWRGRRLIRWTVSGFLLLLLAYFGTKLILEIVLHRV